MKKNIIILVDYRRQFWLTVRHKQASFKLDRLTQEFSKCGYEVVIKNFADPDLLHHNYSDTYVVYQSTEDPMLLYNDFITDVLLAIKRLGAILIPDFYFFRAHHNKVFMEMLRSMAPIEEMQSISSRWFGAYPEYQQYLKSSQCVFPQVVKLSEGCGSRKVILVHDGSEAKNVKRLMWHRDIVFQIKDFIKSIWKSKYPDFKPQTNARRKIVVQNFIPGLTGDFKVLVFNDHFYVLHRKTREHDFRASGSGLFQFPDEVSKSLLDFAKRIYEYFDVPFISMDIAQANEICYLIEFQFVAFGTYTLEKAPWRYLYSADNVWQKIPGTFDLEEEFVYAADNYIKSRYTECDHA